MKLLSLVPFALLISFGASAYDASWYRLDSWSGEYPPGFQVYKKGVEVLGRENLNKLEARTISCVLKRNKYAPMKALPAANYVEMTKILPMKAKVDFHYTAYAKNEKTGEFEEVVIPVKQGESIEYLTYLSEGMFRARYQGLEFETGQDLFDHLEEVDSSAFVSDLWVKVSCFNNVNVWLMLSDLRTADGEGWIDGVRDYFHNPY